MFSRVVFPLALSSLLIVPIVMMTVRARDVDVNLWPVWIALVITALGLAIPALYRRRNRKRALKDWMTPQKKDGNARER